MSNPFKPSYEDLAKYVLMVAKIGKTKEPYLDWSQFDQAIQLAEGLEEEKPKKKRTIEELWAIEDEFLYGRKPPSNEEQK